MSICKDCFHSYVCEQFNENRESDNKKCHFANDHFVSADLINRLQAEIERLKEIIEYKDICIEACEEAKSEAVKEFAGNLENRILSMLTTATLEEKEIICACIGTNNNLLKELVGENDAR